MNKCQEKRIKGNLNATQLPDPQDREGRSDSAPKMNTGEERKFFGVRTTQKGAPSQAKHLREAAHKGTYNPTQGVGPLKGITIRLQEAAHQRDLLPTRKTGGPTIGIYKSIPKGVAEQSKQQDATRASEEAGALSRYLRPLGHRAAGSNPRLRRNWRL